MRKRASLALYGNVKMIRGYCERCKSTAFVLDGKMACCNISTQQKPKKIERMIPTSQFRKKPSKRLQEILLEKFNWSCAYCERLFGSYTSYKGREKKVKLHWDHRIPWKYDQNNNDENFLTSCSSCNLWKHSKIFADLDEVKLYVHQKWEEVQNTEISQWKSKESWTSNQEKSQSIESVSEQGAEQSSKLEAP